MSIPSKSIPIKIDLKLDRYYGELVTKNEHDKNFIKDPIRKKWLVLNPEEMVRQLLIIHLLELSKPIKRLISVEKQINVYGQNKRFDLLIYNEKGQPLLLVECKAPGIELNDEVFEQVSNYNFALGVPYLLITNGRDSYLCHISQKQKTYTFLKHLSLEKLNF